jgi:hypothetical protein
MAILESSGENDLSQLWTLITELSEQLNHNRSASVSLYGLAGKIKVFEFVNEIRISAEPESVA